MPRLKKPNPSRPPTLADIGRLAGVSAMAASAVLNGARSSSRTSPATRERIIKAAARLHYRPNDSARALAKLSRASQATPPDCPQLVRAAPRSSPHSPRHSRELTAALVLCGLQNLEPRQLVLVLGLVSRVFGVNSQDELAAKLTELTFEGYGIVERASAAPPSVVVKTRRRPSA